MSATTTPKSGIGGQGPALLATEYIQATIGIVLVVLRGYAASHTGGKIRWDFIWVVVGTAFGIVGVPAIHIAVNNGLGNYAQDLTYPQIFESLHWIWISIFVGLIAVVFAKLSIISLLLSVQGPTAKKRGYVLWIMGTLIALLAVVQVALSLFECTPIEKLWRPVVEGTCPLKTAAGNFSYFQGGFAALTDFVLALWPISIVWNLQTSRRVKVGFCLLMAVGILPSIASIARIILLPKIASSDDVTYDFATFMFWAVSEFWAVVILGSIPPLRPLFLRVFYGIRSGYSSSYGNSRVTTIPGAVGMQSMTRTNIDGGKTKSGIQTSTMQVLATADDGSEEHVLSNDHHTMNIMVSRAYAVEEVEERPVTGKALTTQDRPQSSKSKGSDAGQAV